ncbi:MAG: tRNA pseudouridine(55) synthase TruB [Gammaproteobacteria bacterium]|jgi:tRNA pseudouridine55 synthase
MSKREPRRDVTGILLLDKPGGMSSNGALQAAKQAFNAAKAGHTGSLDVLATGLLPVCFGEATKISAFLLDADKSYLADIRLGIETNTGDSEGEITRERSIDGIDAAQVDQALDDFRGEIQQIPPMHSALKRNGKRLYKLAHQGIEIERDPRTVTIKRLERKFYASERLTVEVDCTKGTYIRTLAEDIGKALGCGAHISALRRLRSGPFDLADATPLSEIQALRERAAPDTGFDALLVPPDTALADLPDVHLTDEGAVSVTRGQAIRVPDSPLAGFVRLYRSGRGFIGIGTVLDDGRIAPRRMMR